MNRTHIFLDNAFSHHFHKQVNTLSWKCDFLADVLLDSFNQDCELYKDETVFRQRRQKIIPWIENPHQWNKTILGACKELALQRPSIHSKVLEDLHILGALEDFVEHLGHFYTVASTMSDQGYSFQPVSQYSSMIHDLDKIDPIMLLGYSERFEDNVQTSVWDLCVERHVHVNPHHQVHGIWRDSSLDCKKLGTVGESVSRHSNADTKLHRVSDSEHRLYNIDSISYKYCSEDFAVCAHSADKYGPLNKFSASYEHDDATWKHCNMDGASWSLYNNADSWRLYNEANSSLGLCNTDDAAVKNCIKDDTAFVLSNKYSTALKDCVKDDTDLVLCNEDSAAPWYFDEDATNSSYVDEDLSALQHFRTDALREMVCDKVSRRLQKTLNGAISCGMWDVEVAYFDGLPDEWMKKASTMMETLKQNCFYPNL